MWSYFELEHQVYVTLHTPSHHLKQASHPKLRNRCCEKHQHQRLPLRTPLPLLLAIQIVSSTHTYAA